MFKQTLPLERELLFTKAYQKNIDQDKATREYECLKEQVVQSYRTFRREDDIFAGRIENAIVGFYPIFGGDKGLDNAGYCANVGACRENIADARKTGKYEESYLAELEAMADFWVTEGTSQKTRVRITGDLEKSLTGDDYNSEIGVCYPLYRIAGIHLDAKKLCKYGLRGLIELIEEKSKQKPESANMYNAMIGTLELLRDVCQMYVEHIETVMADCNDQSRIDEYKLIIKSLSNIKDNKPQTLHEAIQLITIYMLSCGARDIGRLDDYLCNFYADDIANNVITREFAVRMVENFFDIIEKEFWRDTRAIIGGMGRENGANADEFALVVLDALELRPYSYLPQVSLRYYKAMDQRLYDKSLDLLAKGLTFPLIYNDDVNVDSAQNAMQVPRSSAEQYAFFGCGEYMLACKSIGTPNALINVAKALELSLNNGVDMLTGKQYGVATGEVTDQMDFEDVMSNFQTQIDYFSKSAGQFKELMYDLCNEESSFLLTSILYDDCINRGKALFDGGIEHLGGTVETYGNITACDSLSAIKEVVFDKKAFSLTELVTMLKSDFVGYEAEQKMLLDADKFGNDNKQSDEIAVRVHEGVCNAIRDQHKTTRLDSLLVVIINNNMNISMGRCTAATPDGRIANEYLSNGIGAYNCCDKKGITALMKSMTKMDTSIHAGGNQNFKFSKELFEKREKIKMLLSGFFELGGQQTNISVVNQADLLDAVNNPEKHKNLLVRVGGYTALFIHLDEKTKQEVLTRTAY